MAILTGIVSFSFCSYLHTNLDCGMDGELMDSFGCVFFVIINIYFHIKDYK